MSGHHPWLDDLVLWLKVQRHPDSDRAHGCSSTFALSASQAEDVRALRAEKERLEKALTRIEDNAESWHGDNEAKVRALVVIASTCRAALAGDAATEEQTP